MRNKKDILKAQAEERGIDWLLGLVPDHVARRVAICNEREKGRSYGQIASRHSISRQRAMQLCEYCPELFD